MDADTLEIRAIEVTGNRVGDAPMLPEFLNQIPAGQPIGKVSADGGYDSRACHAAIAARDASAVIPARKNARPWLEITPGAHARNEILGATRRLGRILRTRLPGNGWSGYPRRSLVETKMRCFKLLGARVMARDFDRQVARTADQGRNPEPLYSPRNAPNSTRWARLLTGSDSAAQA